MPHLVQVKEGDVMHDNEKVIKDFEEAVRKAHGEGWDYVDLLTEDGFKILAILEKQGKRINDLEEKLRLLKYGDRDVAYGTLLPAT